MFQDMVTEPVVVLGWTSKAFTLGGVVSERDGVLVGVGVEEGEGLEEAVGVGVEDGVGPGVNEGLGLPSPLTTPLVAASKASMSAPRSLPSVPAFLYGEEVVKR